MASTRYDDVRLAAFHALIVERADRPFAWGSNDCTTFAADAVLALSGVDLLAGIRGTYKSARGARKAAKQATGSSDLLEAVTFVASRNGMAKLQNPLCAMRGDLVLAEQLGEDLVCGVVGTSGRWIHAPGEAGLVHLCLTAARHAWTY